LGAVLKKHASKLGIDPNSFSVSISFSDAQLAEIISLRRSGLKWSQLMKKYNKKNKPEKTVDSLRNAFRQYQNYFEQDPNSDLGKDPPGSRSDEERQL
jgi:hypothetical protein